MVDLAVIETQDFLSQRAVSLKINGLIRHDKSNRPLLFRL
jgi:hypothetical protein